VQTGLLSGRATGVGSMPGSDIDASIVVVADALPDLPHLPELPGRGAGADMVGRTAVLLVDLPVDLQPAGWRLVSRPGVDESRAVAMVERDLDALVPALAGHTGPLKVQLCGPWTLAAALELPRGGAVLRDPGAVRDLVESLAETLPAHVAAVRRRLPHAEVIVQVDEPALPLVVEGAVPTESGLGRLAAVPIPDATAVLARVIAAAGVPVVAHCCAADPALALLHDAGAAAVSFDLAAVGARLDYDDVAEHVEGGLVLWPGVLPAVGPGAAPTVREVLAPVRTLLDRVGPAGVTLTPACGLAGASEGWARTALRLVQQAARALADETETVPT
jgi:hypothetical protein